MIYIYAFSRHFYPKRLTVHSDYTFFVSMCVPWELNPQPFALLMQCFTTEPQEHGLKRASTFVYVFEERVLQTQYHLRARLTHAWHGGDL